MFEIALGMSETSDYLLGQVLGMIRRNITYKDKSLIVPLYKAIVRGRNKPKLPLVRRISDMLQTTCPPTCPLVQVFVHFVGPKLDALDRQNSGQGNVRDDMGLTDSVPQAQLCCYFLSEVFEIICSTI